MLPLLLQATANLVPLNSKRVAVKFDFFKIASLVSDALLVITFHILCICHY